jgi:hypothetical protein
MQAQALAPLENFFRERVLQRMMTEEEDRQAVLMIEAAVQDGVSPGSIYQAVLYTMGDWTTATRARSVAQLKLDTLLRHNAEESRKETIRRLTR